MTFISKGFFVCLDFLERFNLCQRRKTNIHFNFYIRSMNLYLIDNKIYVDTDFVILTNFKILAKYILNNI